MTQPPPPFDPSALARIPADVLARYDRPGPRYTSYPTAPAWSDDYGEADYLRALARSRDRGAPLSLYLHIPFCESLCVYCGCNVVITKKRERATHYVEVLEAELEKLAGHLGAGQRLTEQVAWGGGTPTYLEPDQIEGLAARSRELFPLAPGAEVAIETDPRVTRRKHVEAIVRAGFNRISMGIQDFDRAVQEEIHRVQSFEMTRELVGWCRQAGIESVNVDLVYGLPLQTLEGFDATIDRVFELDPDRVSAFSYAHVPWIKPQHKKFREETIPHGADKFAIFARLVERLCAGGYELIGMDHFAKPDNELALAQREGRLWRNFQGFTTKSGTDLVGAGMTSISSLADSFAQNEKDLAPYHERIDHGLATVRGLDLSQTDVWHAAVIQDLMCRYRFDPERVGQRFGIDALEVFRPGLERLDGFERDGLIEREGDGFALTSAGRFFVRNVCMAFDEHLPEESQRTFSRTI